MFNFDCQVKTKVNFEIKDNELYVDGIKDNTDYSAQDANKVIETYFNTIKSKTVKAIKYLNSLDLKTLVQEMKYLDAAKELLISIKKNVCTGGRYGSRSNTLENFESEVTCYFKNILREINNKKYSYPEKMVINTFGGSFEGELENYSTNEYYEPETDKITILKEYQEVLAYDYSQFGLNNKQMITDFMLVFNNLKNEIKDFKKVIALAGNDLVNWSGMKVTRRCRDNKLSCSHNIHTWVESYQQHLIKSGVKIDDKNISKAEKASLKLKQFEAGKKVKIDQADLLRVFKTKSLSEAEKAIELMGLASITEIMNSDLKCVTDKRSEANIQKCLIVRYCAVAETKEHYKALVKFVNSYKYKEIKDSYSRPPKGFDVNGLWGYVTTGYMVKSQDYITVEDMLMFGKTHHDYSAGADFFDKVMTKVPEEKRFSMSRCFNFEYLKRMTAKDLIKVFSKLSHDNVVMEEAVELYHNNVAYSSIRDQLLDNNNFITTGASWIVVEKDADLAEIALSKYVGEYNDKDCPDLMNLLTYEKKVEVILKEVKKSGKAEKKNEYSYNYYSHNNTYGAYLEKIFSAQELLTFMNELLLLGNYEAIQGYLKKVCEVYNTKKYSTKRFNDILMNTNLDNVVKFPIDSNSIALFSNDVKVRLLETDCINLNEIKAREIIHSYESYTNLREFFKTLTRQEAIKALGNACLSGYNTSSVFLAHVMTEVEMSCAADVSNTFLRANLEQLPYGYLKKYTDKGLFKRTVGDCRDRTNKAFAQALVKKLDIPNSMDFILSLGSEANEQA